MKFCGYEVVVQVAKDSSSRRDMLKCALSARLPCQANDRTVSKPVLQQSPVSVQFPFGLRGEIFLQAVVPFTKTAHSYVLIQLLTLVLVDRPFCVCACGLRKR